MSVKKLHIFYANFFSQRDYDRFEIDTLLSEGVDVAIWEMTPLFLQSQFKAQQPKPLAGNVQPTFYRTIRQVLRDLATLTEADHVIFCLPPSFRSYWILRRMGQLNIHYSTIYMSLPRVFFPMGKEKILFYLSTMNLHKGLEILYKLSGLQQRLTNRPQYSLICGGTDTKRLGQNARECIMAHSLDYEIFRTCKGNVAQEEDIAVFIDEAMTCHPENLTWRINNVSEELYYPLMRRFFDWVEATTGLKVVICAHPRSNYSDREAPFGDRQIVRGNTCEIIGRSKLTLAHMSTATGYAVLFRKPIAFLTFKEMSAYTQAYIRSYADELKRPILDLHQPATWPSIPFMDVDGSVYEGYMERHIKLKNAPDSSPWTTFLRHLRTTQTPNA